MIPAAIPNPPNVFFVATSCAPYSSLEAALSAATLAGPSVSNPLLVKVGPGVYDVNSNSAISVPSFVRIAGSGQGTTVIRLTGSGGVSLSDDTALEKLTVNTASNAVGTMVEVTGTATLNDLEIKSTAAVSATAYGLTISGTEPTVNLTNVSINMANDQATFFVGCTIDGATTIRANNLSIFTKSINNFGLLATAPVDVLIENSNFIAESTTESSTAVRVGTAGSGTGLVLRNSFLKASTLNAIATAAPVYVSTNRNVTLENTRIVSTGSSSSASYGVGVDDNGKLVLSHSTVQTNTGVPTLTTSNTGSTIEAGNTKLAGGAVSSEAGTTITCAGVFDENLTFSSSTCP